MATDSGTLAWRIPWMEEPGGLPSMGSQRVGHDVVINMHRNGVYGIEFCCVQSLRFRCHLLLQYHPAYPGQSGVLLVITTCCRIGR